MYGANYCIAKNADDVIQHLNNLIKSDKKYVYRGFSNVEELYPKIMRESIALVKYEHEILNQFERKCGMYINVHTAIDFVACAQHYGLSTRLLDFSHNPFVALAFAIEKEKKNEAQCGRNEYYCVIYIPIEENLLLDGLPEKSAFWNNSSKQLFSSQAIKSFKNIENLFEIGEYNPNEWMTGTNLKNIEPEFVKKCVSDKQLLFVEPSVVAYRILAQQGLFMVPYLLDRERFKQLIMRHSELLLIPVRLRNELRNYLKSVGYDMYHLMPDIESACKEIYQEMQDKIDEEKEKRMPKLFDLEK